MGTASRPAGCSRGFPTAPMAALAVDVAAFVCYFSGL